jgi:lipoic acid synthetase
MKKAFPPWIKWKAPDPKILQQMKRLLKNLNLHTICESAHCPNIGFCFSRKTATFLILGDICTRRCTFCAVKKGTPLPVDINETLAVAKAVRRLGLQYVVITSVTRDDLSDGGASQFVKIIEILHQQTNNIGVEVLIPDFKGSFEALQAVVNAGPQVINHNIETVSRLYPAVRPGAAYKRSLALLSKVKQMNPKIITKSGLMLGLGETKTEVIEALRNLRNANCDLLTIGQYLQPSYTHHEIITFVTPEEFSEYEHIGLKMGFTGIVSAPLARSSLKAKELYLAAKADMGFQKKN